MARRSQLRGRGAASTATMTMLIGFLAVNAFGFFGLQSAGCRGLEPSQSVIGTIQILVIAAVVLALYALIAMIRRRMTMRRMPLEAVAAVLALLLSIAWQVVYFIDCSG